MFQYFQVDPSTASRAHCSAEERVDIVKKILSDCKIKL